MERRLAPTTPANGALPRPSPPINHLIVGRRYQIVRTSVRLLARQAHDGGSSSNNNPSVHHHQVFVLVVVVVGVVVGQVLELVAKVVRRELGGRRRRSRHGPFRHGRQARGHMEEERAENRQAGADDGGVDLSDGPERGRDVVVGGVCCPGGGAKGRDADDGYDADTSFFFVY